MVEQEINTNFSVKLNRLEAHHETVKKSKELLPLDLYQYQLKTEQKVADALGMVRVHFKYGLSLTGLLAISTAFAYYKKYSIRHGLLLSLYSVGYGTFYLYDQAYGNQLERHGIETHYIYTKQRSRHFRSYDHIYKRDEATGDIIQSNYQEQDDNDDPWCRGDGACTPKSKF